MSQNLNQYAVTLRDGKIYHVNTPNHHTNHNDADFEEHLIDIIKQTVSGVIAGGIIKIIFKGKV